MFSRLVFFIALLVYTYSTTAFGGQLSNIFKKVSPSVVILKIYERTPFRQTKSKEKMVSIEGLGSGVLISEDGKILTAAHVVHLADSIHVIFSNGDEALAKVIASEPSADIALIQIEKIPKNIQYVPLANSDDVEVGDDVFIIGAPYGIGHSFTAGFISGRRKSESQEAFGGAEFFQTDAAINQGNSGGPMFNAKGEIIGIVSHILSKSGGFEGLGFAVTINTAKNLLLQNRGFWSGMEGRIIKGNLAEILHLPQETGYLVERVAQDSLLAKADIRAGEILANIDGVDMVLGGDIILSVEGIQVGKENSYASIINKMRTLKTGEKLNVRVLRGNQIKVAYITIPEKY